MCGKPMRPVENRSRPLVAQIPEILRHLWTRSRNIGECERLVTVAEIRAPRVIGAHHPSMGKLLVKLQIPGVVLALSRRVDQYTRSPSRIQSAGCRTGDDGGAAGGEHG